MGLRGHTLSRLQTALIVAPSFILFGYNQAGIGGLITQDDWVATFPEIDTVHANPSEKGPRSTLQGFVVAVFVIGALFGSLSCSWTGDHYGRRKIIFVAGILTLLGEVLEATSTGLPQFVIGRIIVGFGIGQLSSLVPVWQSETSGADNRGRHVVLDGLFICLGYVLESWINLRFFEYQTGPITWRPPIAIACVFSLILISSIYLFPESPRWLLMMGKKEQALENLTILRCAPPDSREIEGELSGIELSLDMSKKHGAGLSQLFRAGRDKLPYRFALCILLQFFQQMSGSNLISVYAPILFQENLGLSSEMSRILSGGALTWKFLSSFLAFVAIDRFGRRAVFMASGAGMSCCMVALAIATSFPASNRPAQVIACCFIFLYNTFVPIGFLGANFLYCTEVAPIRLRMAMSSISTANHWAWNFIIAMVTPVAIYSIGWQYYIIFAIIAACIPVTVYCFFPETMGRTLEEIDLLFKGSPSVCGTVQFERKLRRNNAHHILREKLEGDLVLQGSNGDTYETFET
ncbi:general substrate transporter [Hypoxylon trugodes]|uniref:general substrate transporter n=1 Tax=Hypoxylon trugodes TaxID=326681 RepID=UPI00219E13B4|nr:general substrate transporter [Hypoxylon trugodes]KAI1382830.1 general substrate transporter [Hypoxylon trugodes]